MGIKRLISTVLLSACCAAVLVAFCFSLPFPAYSQPDEMAGETATTGIRLLVANEQMVQFELTTTAVSHQNGLLQANGLNSQIHTPGAPALPTYATYLALPPEANVSVTVQPALARHTTLPPPLLPAPTFTIDDSSLPPSADLAQQVTLWQSQLSQPRYTADPAIYNQDQAYPGQLYAVSQPMYLRDLRLVQLTLYPVQYNPVRQQVQQWQRLTVTVRFSGPAMTEIRPSPDSQQQYPQAWQQAILNYDTVLRHPQQWRSLPPAVTQTPATVLPIGLDTYKIELHQDGIYQISADDLQAAGMDIANIDPATLQMLYRGQPVAYQFIGDGDTVLESGELIRFYGWAFTGSRLEKQFISENVYWLWAGGTAVSIPTIPNEANQGFPIVQEFPESITVDTPEIYHFHTRTNQWEQYPNEPDAWYIDYFLKSTQTSLTRNYTIILPDPAPSGPDAVILAEIMTRDTPNINNIYQTHIGRVNINSDATYGENTWGPKENVNVTHTVPITVLQNFTNTIHYTTVTTTTSTARERLYTNRVTVDYTRQLKALHDQLIFTAPDSGSHEFQVQNFTQADPAQVLVWDISQPTQPVQIEMTGFISQTGSTYQYQIGRTHGDNGRFIATTTSHILTPTTISQYIPVSLAPPTNQAQWLAITHSDFITAATTLAAHRTDPTFNGFTTWVVDIHHILNQYGYGLPLPGAIRAYLTYALGHWDIAPSYVTLFGDATFDPLHLPCATGCAAGFDANAPTYLVTDLIFEDPYQGLIPSDHTLVLLSGDDILADMAIGRIAANTALEAQTAVDKIIQYETMQLDPATWATHQNILMVADNTDDAGDFCAENQSMRARLPANFNVTALCLPDSTVTATLQLQAEMQTAVNTGISILNYRGHGSVWAWADESILSATSTDFWFNSNKPAVILSADCLDGYFTYPGLPGLGESFLKLHDDALPNIGTAAHWSSTGLGTTYEHSALLNDLYLAIFRDGVTTLGDAINIAKAGYLQSGYMEAELYSFFLQGDPAMWLYRPDLSLTLTPLQSSVVPSSTLSFSLDVANTGLYPTYATIRDILPPGLSFVSASSSLPLMTTVSANEVTIELQAPISEGSSANILLTAFISPTVTGGVYTTTATVSTLAGDLDLTNNSDSATFNIVEIVYYLFLPAVNRP